MIDNNKTTGTYDSKTYLSQDYTMEERSIKKILPKCITDLGKEALRKCFVIEQKTVDEIIPLLPHFNIGEKHPWAVLIRVEIHTSNKENDSTSSSSSQENTFIEVENYLIEKFVTSQLRQLCIKLGITQASKMNKVQIGFAIGLVVSSNLNGLQGASSNHMRNNMLLLKRNGPPERKWITTTQVGSKSNNNDDTMSKKTTYKCDRMAKKTKYEGGTRLDLLNELEKLETMILKYDIGSIMRTNMQGRINEISEKLFGTGASM